MPSTVGITSAAGNLKNKTEPRLLGYKVNYIQNPSFELGTTNWSGIAGATFERITTDSVNGSACLKVFNVSGSAIAHSGVPLEVSGTYYVSAWVKQQEGNTTATNFIRFIQTDTLGGTVIQQGNVAVTTPTIGQWTRISGSFTKNASANYVTIRVATGSTSSSDVFFVDSVMLQKTDSLEDYFDGDSESCFWTLTPHNSFSGKDPYF
jgi:hypothetical protein